MVIDSLSTPHPISQTLQILTGSTGYFSIIVAKRTRNILSMHLAYIITFESIDIVTTYSVEHKRKSEKMEKRFMYRRSYKVSYLV